MVKTKTSLLPSDLRDFLSIISIIGFVAIFLQYAFEWNYLNDNMVSMFLIIGGLGLFIAGKGVKLKDGIQTGEVGMVLSIIIGLSSAGLGVAILFNAPLTAGLLGIVGVVALFLAMFILLDYIVKNM